MHIPIGDATMWREAKSSRVVARFSDGGALGKAQNTRKVPIKIILAQKLRRGSGTY